MWHNNRPEVELVICRRIKPEVLVTICQPSLDISQLKCHNLKLKYCYLTRRIDSFKDPSNVDNLTVCFAAFRLKK